MVSRLLIGLLPILGCIPASSSLICFDDGNKDNIVYLSSGRKEKVTEITLNEDIKPSRIFLNDNYSSYYFSNLKNNYGVNNVGSCNFISLAMILSFYDTYWDDRIISEVYDEEAVLSDNFITFKSSSPGFKTEPILPDITIPEYMNDVEEYYREYFQFYLIDLFNKEYRSIRSNLTISNTEFAGFLGFYLDHILPNQVEYEIHQGEASTESDLISIKNQVISLVRNGIPVKIGLGDHSAIAYDYDHSSDRIFCHFGLGSDLTHVAIDDLGYDTIYNFVALEITSDHVHSNNYIYNQTGEVAHCSCSLKTITHVTTDNYYIDVLPTITWETLNREKWPINNNLAFCFELANGDGNTIYSERGRQSSYFVPEKEDWDPILKDQDDFFIFRVKFDVRYIDDEEMGTNWPLEGTTIPLSAPSHNSILDEDFYEQRIYKPLEAKLVHQIRPEDYGFADAYPTDVATSENYIEHNLPNGLKFYTRRYRVGYIQKEKIVLSPIRKNINRAFIEYKFDEPIVRLDFNISLWRDSSFEKINPSNGEFFLQVKYDNTDNNTWVTYYDFFHQENVVPEDRNNPRPFFCMFPQPVYRFKFVAASTINYEYENNRGRLCLGSISPYFLNEKRTMPLSGSELDTESAKWINGNLLDLTNCYSYMLNNQTEPMNFTKILERQQPGNLALPILNLQDGEGKRPNYYFTDFRIYPHTVIRRTREDINYMNDILGGYYFERIDKYDVCPEGMYKVALCLTDEMLKVPLIQNGKRVDLEYGHRDYHWYRQDSSGTWSHKIPGYAPMNVDSSNNLIYDPETCDRGAYSEFVDFFAVMPWNSLYRPPQPLLGKGGFNY